MADLLLNGRFLTRPGTGVDRVATELTAALIRQVLPPGLGNLHVLHPPRPLAGGQTIPRAVTARARSLSPGLPGPLWEQAALCRLRPTDWLLSLCNTGPVLRRRQVVMLHDAQVFQQPEAYSPVFRRWYRFVLPRLGRRAAMVLTVSHHARRQLERCGVVPQGRARVVANGADHILRFPPDPATLARHGLRRGGYILAIGSLALHKNLGRLQQAAQARAGHPVPLVLAGGGDRAVFQAHNMHPGPGLRLLGRVSDGELRALYEGALALALPSLTEGFGLPAAEAMLCGCPVIASTGGALPEVCGTAALLVDPLDVRGWRAAMEQVEADPLLCARLSADGRRRAQTFTWEAAAKTLIRHLRDLPK